MSIAQTLLRSRAVAALTSPHGVDRYLELVNPMWAAHEVRARVVDVRPRGRRARAPAGRDDHPAAHRAPGAATAPASTCSSASRSTAPAAPPGCSRSPAPTRARGDRFTDHAAGQPRRASSRGSSSSAPRPGTIVHLSQAEGDFVLPDRVPDARPVDLRRLRHHPGDVDAALAAAPHPPRPGHVRALRAEPGAPDLRRRARRRSAAPATIDVHLLHPELGDPALSPA